MQPLLLFALLIGPDLLDGAVGVADAPVARAVITDEFGGKVPVQPLARGGVFIFSAKAATRGTHPLSVQWEVTQAWVLSPTDADPKAIKAVSPSTLNQRSRSMRLLDENDQHNPCFMVPYGNDYVGFTVMQFVALGDTGSKASVDLIVEGGIPPPDPEPEPSPKPKPVPPKPVPVIYDHLILLVVYEARNLSPTAAGIKASTYWNKLEAAGHSWGWYSTDTEEGKAIQSTRAEGIKLPALVIFDKATNKHLGSEALPDSTLKIDAKVREWTGKHVLSAPTP